MKNLLPALVLVFIQFVYSGHAQPNIVVSAPGANYYSQSMLPSGMSNQTYERGCFLIRQNELAALISNSITSIGFSLEQGTGSIPVSGNITIYMENTGNFNYSKSNTFTTVISGMTNVFSGNMTIPASQTNSVNLIFTLPTTFNYTGGGLYIAFDWVTTSPSATCGTCGYTWYYTNRSGTNMAAYRNSVANNASLATLSGSTDRPVCVFGALNAATNEAEVMMINSDGKIAESLHANYEITADVMNKSINPLNNLNVSLNISGANPFTDTQVVPTIAPGAIETVTFSSFSPSALGANLVAVSIPSDQNNTNNIIYLNQEVTCDRLAHNPPSITYTASYGNQNFPVMCFGKFNFSTSNTLIAVNIAIQVDYTPNVTLYGVLMDSNNTILATSNTVNAVPLTVSSFQLFTFTTPQPLSPNQDYYIGLAESKGFFMAANEAIITPFTYFSANGSGGNLIPVSFGYFGIEPVIAGPELLISQANTVICNGESMELTVYGASNYTWSASVFNPITNPYSSNITVAPTSNEMYNVFGIDDAGCSNSTSAPLAVNACVGLTEYSDLKNIKLYPNPSVNGKSVISGLTGVTNVLVYNVLGELVLSMKSTEETASIDVSNMPDGSYLIKIIDSENNFKTVKLIHQH